MSKRLDRMFTEKPPLRPLSDLAAIVEDWNYRFGKAGISEALRDTIVEFCADAPDLETAIDRACRSIRPNGKCHNHQSRVPKLSRDAYAIMLKADHGLRHVRDFETLIVICEKDAVWGIGPVTVYDVAVRIGAFLRLAPERVYLHAHVLHGYVALCGYPDGIMPKSLAVADLPAELHGLPPDEIEDFLCTYSDYFLDLPNAR